MGEEGRFLTVDFAGKRTKHARVYRALWCPRKKQVHWEDGNVWTKVHSVTR